MKTATRSLGWLSVIAATVLALPRQARAVTVSGSDSIYVRAVGDQNLSNDSSATRLPTFDFLSLDVSDLGVEGLSFRGAGWGRWDSLGKEGGDLADADLSYGYLNYRSNGWVPSLRAGRQFLSMGVAHDWIDGAVVQSREVDGFGVSGFTGVPVVSQVGTKQGDYLWGGRFHWRQTDQVELGVSYVGSRENENVDRQQVGLDAFVSPGRWLELSGTGGWDTISDRLFDVQATARSTVADWFQLFAGFDYTVPSDLVSKASIFSVFSDGEVQEISGGAAVSPTDWVTVTAQLAQSHYGGSGGERIGSSTLEAYRFGGDVQFHPGGRPGAWLSPGDGVQVGLGAYRTDGLQGSSTLVASDFTELRAFVSYDLLDDLTLAPDAELFLYDRDIRGKAESVSITSALSYAYSPDVDFGGSVSWSTNPFFENEVEGLLRARCRFSVSFFE